MPNVSMGFFHAHKSWQVLASNVNVRTFTLARWENPPLTPVLFSQSTIAQ